MADLETINFSLEQYGRMKRTPQEVVRGEDMSPGMFGFVLLLRNESEAGAQAIQYPAEVRSARPQIGRGDTHNLSFSFLPENTLGGTPLEGWFVDGIWQPENSSPIYITGALATEGFLRKGNMPTEPARRPAGTINTLSARRMAVSEIVLPETPNQAPGQA